MLPGHDKTTRGPRKTEDPIETRDLRRRLLSTGFRLGEWWVEPSTHRMSRDLATVPLEPKVMAVLVLLAENAGQVVEKETIIRSVWPDTAISEVAVPRTISELRRALRDNARQPRYIEPIPTKGYRLICTVGREPPGKADVDPDPKRTTRAQGRGRSATVPGRNGPKIDAMSHLARRVATIAALLVGATAAIGAIQSLDGPSSNKEAIQALAVLPLRNLSDAAEEEYFADGMTDLLITDLAQLGRFRVISSTSVMRFKNRHRPLREIARELGVDAIVEGTVLRADERVRITAQLIDAADDEHLWAGTYERRLDDVLDLQSEVARAIAGHVRASLAPGELERIGRRHDIEPVAYDLYLKGRQLWRQRGVEGLRQAAEYFRQSLERDPRNALAHAGLSDVYIVQVANGLLPPEDGIPPAKRQALKALRLDDELAEAHVSLAMIRYFFEWDSYSAEHHFRRGLKLNPGYATGRQWHAMFLASQGRFEEAVTEAELARKLDPLTAQNHVNISRVFYYSGHYEQAVEALEQAAALDEKCRAHVLFTQAQISTLAEATAESRQELAAQFDDEHELCDERGDASRGELRKTCTGHQYYRALRHAVLGDDQRALDDLEWSLEKREFWLLYAAVEPFFAALRADPSFQDLLAEIGLEGVTPAPARPVGETTESHHP